MRVDVLPSAVRTFSGAAGRAAALRAAQVEMRSAVQALPLEASTLYVKTVVALPASAGPWINERAKYLARTPRSEISAGQNISRKFLSFPSYNPKTGTLSFPAGSIRRLPCGGQRAVARPPVVGCTRELFGLDLSQRIVPQGLVILLVDAL